MGFSWGTGYGEDVIPSNSGKCKLRIVDGELQIGFCHDDGWQFR
jgi:hypothetical protein